MSCLKLFDYHDQWCNMEGIYAFFFFNLSLQIFIVSSSKLRDLAACPRSKCACRQAHLKT